MIRMAALTKEYQSESERVLALDKIDLHIESGDIFGIIGLSGAGKSTLLRCINLLERPSAGTVWVDGEDITAWRGRKLRELRSQIGMVFQSFNLFMQSDVEHNIAFPMSIAGVPRAKRKERVQEMLRLVGLEGLEKRYPSQLSGGQQQRVSIARALSNNPKILLCDEPTSALDSVTTLSILDLLKEINQKLGITIVIISHDADVVRRLCRHVAVIDRNRIVEIQALADLAPSTQIARQLLKLEVNADGSCI